MIANSTVISLVRDVIGIQLLARLLLAGESFGDPRGFLEMALPCEMCVEILLPCKSTFAKSIVTCVVCNVIGSPLLY
jgi:hypothetical protein